MAGGSGGQKAVLLAIMANSVLVAIKFVAYFFSGSGAMLAEAIHSLADVGNQTLLWIGLKRSQQGPSKQHPFGYGKARFVWALISAAGIFFVGCGVSVTHGIHALLHPEPPRPVGWMVVGVLAISFVLDAFVLVTAVRALGATRGSRSWLEFLRTTPDTATVAVLFEDGAACLGIILAAVGIFCAQKLGVTWADPAAAIAIGLLLGGVAIFLGRQNQRYLLDRSIENSVRSRILGIIRGASSGAVRDILHVKTRVVGGDQLVFSADVDFDGTILSDRIQARTDLTKAYQDLKSPEDLDRLLDEHARIVVEELGEEVNRIEAAVRAQVPGADFIQLEVH